MDDYDDRLGYDADHRDASQYCSHGTFIGSWWGPDYLCGWCESGEEPPTFEETKASELKFADAQSARFDALVADLDRSIRHRLSFGHAADWLFDMADYDDFGRAQRLYRKYGLA